jgi:hypothetical protein
VICLATLLAEAAGAAAHVERDDDGQ